MRQRYQAKAPRRWVPLERARPLPNTKQEIAEQIAFGAKHGIPEAEVRATLADVDRNDQLWINDRYQVAVREMGGVVQLSIRRLDRQPVRDWRDCQRIKNQLVGPECEAVELYPAEIRKVDTANQYFLWAVADPTYRFPFGFRDRLVSSESTGGAVQRPDDEILA